RRAAGPASAPNADATEQATAAEAADDRSSRRLSMKRSPRFSGSIAGRRHIAAQNNVAILVRPAWVPPAPAIPGLALILAAFGAISAPDQPPGYKWQRKNCSNFRAP